MSPAGVVSRVPPETAEGRCYKFPVAEQLNTSKESLIAQHGPTCPTLVNQFLETEADRTSHHLSTRDFAETRERESKAKTAPRSGHTTRGSLFFFLNRIVFHKLE
jgi:hypothetical protein